MKKSCANNKNKLELLFQLKIDEDVLSYAYVCIYIYHLDEMSSILIPLVVFDE